MRLFTGIIEEVGTVRRMRTGGMTIAAKHIMGDVKLGDSIAVNGVCLTVCEMSADSFSADVMPETLRRTNLGTLKVGSAVNLERAMAANGRFGGHIVSGHIDGTGTVVSLRKEGNATWVTISALPELLRYIVVKGSVAIDGISLTVAKVSQHDFSVSIIPHTGSETTLLHKKCGEQINLECDIVAKYIEKLCGRQSGGTLTADFLAAHGFV